MSVDAGGEWAATIDKMGIAAVAETQPPDCYQALYQKNNLQIFQNNAVFVNGPDSFLMYRGEKAYRKEPGLKPKQFISSDSSARHPPPGLRGRVRRKRIAC